MHFHELLGFSGPLTHRQFLAWNEFLDMEMERPSRADMYVMQAGHEARYAMAKKRPRFNSKDYKLKFSEEGSQVPTMTKEQAAAISKARWCSMMTVPIQHRTRSAE